MDGVSAQDDVRDASEALDARLSQVDFGEAQVFVMLGHPRSDIGKAELVARLGLLVGKDFSIIKVDGFLNTNQDGRHPSRTRNDFVVYRRIHSHIEFGGSHLILNAPLMIDFFEKFGECKEHLMFSPHLAKYFVLRVFENWTALGKPSRLIIEIGGTYLDTEVSSYIVPGLAFLNRLSDRIAFFLLTEAGFNREGIKVRPVIHALTTGRARGLSFDTVFVRLPSDFPKLDNTSELNRYVERKITDSLVFGGYSPKIICVPYYNDCSLTGYTEFLSGFRDSIFPTIGSSEA